MGYSLESKFRSIFGDDFSSDELDRLSYSRDLSWIEGMPDYVAIPRSVDQISQALQLAYSQNIPITPRGSGSGVTGGCVPLKGGLVLDLSRMNRILDVDPQNLSCIVEPGITRNKLCQHLSRHGVYFPPDPGSSDICSIGGMISNDSSGMNAFKFGTTKNWVLDLEVVDPQGKIISTGSSVIKSVAGYDLTRLFVGSEGTLGVISKAKLRLHPLPESQISGYIQFSEIKQALEFRFKLLRMGIIPDACEFLDSNAIQAANSYLPDVFPQAEILVLVKLSGDSIWISRSCQLISGIYPRIHFLESSSDQERIWRARRVVGVAISGIVKHAVRAYHAEDIVVPPSKLAEAMLEIKRILRELQLGYVMFGHLLDGNIHLGMLVDLRDPATRKRILEAAGRIYELALRLGGSITGEHGIGAIRIDWLRRQNPSGYELMKLIKSAIDPKNLMNPGKLF